jgi:hypothetical protein
MKTSSRRFTQYLSRWHEGRMTKTIIDRESLSVWMTYHESGRSTLNAPAPVQMTAEAIAQLEASLVACGCERVDHS